MESTMSFMWQTKTSIYLELAADGWGNLLLIKRLFTNKRSLALPEFAGFKLVLTNLS